MIVFIHDTAETQNKWKTPFSILGCCRSFRNRNLLNPNPCKKGEIILLINVPHAYSFVCICVIIYKRILAVPKRDNWKSWSYIERQGARKHIELWDPLNGGMGLLFLVLFEAQVFHSWARNKFDRFLNTASIMDHRHLDLLLNCHTILGWIYP